MSDKSEPTFEMKCSNLLEEYLSCVSKDNIDNIDFYCKNILDKYNKCLTKKIENVIANNSEYKDKYIKPVKPKKIRNSVIPGTKEDVIIKPNNTFESNNMDLLFLYNIKPYSSY